MPQQPKFKVGDPVKYTLGGNDKPDDLWYGLVIKTVDTESNGRLRYMCDSNPDNSIHKETIVGGFYEDWLVLDESRVVVLTPQELADKYRALRAEAQAISKQLQGMGFEPQYKSDLTTLWTKMSSDHNQTYRFVNVLTTIL